MDDCIFCKISKGEIPTEFLYEDDRAVAFDDINPEAPVHVIIIPREHIPSFNDLGPEHKDLLGHLSLVMKEVARLKGVQESGYRILTNCGTGAGQVVFHLHFHLLGGKRFR
ncbi:MAG TPA: histidine triad nucleotide-binding protein [Firmicutes bacterium]|mgnify:CR=1 FL=1|nr:histidine triad nucleotide-binding protein [Bacillota bacterium]